MGVSLSKTGSCSKSFCLWNMWMWHDFKQKWDFTLERRGIHQVEWRCHQSWRSSDRPEDSMVITMTKGTRFSPSLTCRMATQELFPLGELECHLQLSWGKLVTRSKSHHRIPKISDQGFNMLKDHLFTDCFTHLHAEKTLHRQGWCPAAPFIRSCLKARSTWAILSWITGYGRVKVALGVQSNRNKCLWSLDWLKRENPLESPTAKNQPAIWSCFNNLPYNFKKPAKYGVVSTIFQLRPQEVRYGHQMFPNQIWRCLKNTSQWIPQFIAASHWILGGKAFWAQPFSPKVAQGSPRYR